MEYNTFGEYTIGPLGTLPALGTNAGNSPREEVEWARSQRFARMMLRSGGGSAKPDSCKAAPRQYLADEIGISHQQGSKVRNRREQGRRIDPVEDLESSRPAVGILFPW